MSFLDTVETIAYLGPAGSYTEMAKDLFCKHYELNLNLQPMNTIKQVLEFVDENPNSVAVLPVENSIEGTVRETIDNLIKTKNENIQILSELIMPIKHCLLSRTTEFSSITGIISHPQAVAQCQNFIHNELPRHTDIIEAASTAEAARNLQNYNMTYGAIGSEKTAELYYLNVLKDNINDDPDNQTRFALIGDFKTAKADKAKTALAFSTENRPGALLDILQVFRSHGINLSYIDSRPSKVQFGQYIFFVEFDGHILDENISKVIEKVKAQTEYYRVVGSYERL